MALDRGICIHSFFNSASTSSVLAVSPSQWSAWPSKRQTRKTWEEHDAENGCPWKQFTPRGGMVKTTVGGFLSADVP